MRIQAPRVDAPSLVDLVDVDPDRALDPAGTDGCRIVGAVLDGVRRTGVTYRETELVRATVSGTRLADCRFIDVRLDALDAPDLVAPGSTWRDVEVVGSRLGTWGVHESTLNGLLLDRCKIGFLGLQGSKVQDLVIQGCAIEELDLSDADATRVALRETTIEQLRLRDARLHHVDLRGARLAAVDPVGGLRGATITLAQLLDLAPDLASALGILVD